MLEERLSKAYSQHSLGGYNLPAPRQSSAPYPSIGAPTTAENFYTGDPQLDYARPPGMQAYGQPPQSAPQYAVYDKRASMAGPPNGQYAPQQLQRTDSWGTNGPAPAPQPQFFPQPSYLPTETAPNQQPGQAPQIPQQPPLAGPSAPDSVGTTPTADPNASFYFNNAQSAPQAPSQPAHPASDSPYPNLQQSMHSYQPSPAQTPSSNPAQPVQPGGQTQQGQHQQPYWQHSAAQQTQLPPVWQPQQQAPDPYNGYVQETFPSAPQHAPKQPVVEEALIEL